MTDLLKQVVEALEPFANAFKREIQDGGAYIPRQQLDLEPLIGRNLLAENLARAADLLPKLRAAIEQGSQGFAEWMHQYEHWLKAKGYNLPLGCRDHAAVAYLAGQQSAAQRITELEAEVQNLKETTR